MTTRTLLAACAVAAASAWAPMQAGAADVWIRQAPPPARTEAAPPPRHGYVWVPGYWEWRGSRHVWHDGTWMRERRGYVYRSPEWVERNGRWHLERRGWARADKDHDGVPNRADRDRDGDGVPNRVDRRPDNPRKS